MLNTRFSRDFSMSNWVETNPARSFIIYTIFIAGTVWVAFAFIFDENKVAVYKAQVENEKASANQYKAKTEVLEVEVAQLREENKKYLEWMVSTPNTIPYLEQKINRLVEENNRQKSELVGVAHAESSGTATLSLPLYLNSKVLNVGESLIDPKTNITFGIGRITPDFTTSAVLNIPGAKPQELSQVKAGSSWTFYTDNRHYQLTVSKIDWFSNKAEVILKEIESKEAKTSLQGRP